MFNKTSIVLVSFVVLTTSCMFAEPAFIPWPQAVTMNTGTMTLSPDSRIAVGDASLEPLAIVVSQEVFLATGLSLAVGGTNAASGDIYLAQTSDPTVMGETYKLTVADFATIEADNYRAAAYGSVTLLQAITTVAGTNPQYSIPKMAIRDWPDVDYRGQMIDLARQWHTIDAVKEYVRLCRLYKIKYLQLHLSDDQSFTFPTTNYPAIPGPGTRKYTYEQMHDLEAYAVARGVTIIPEIDVPAHATRMCAAMPALFGRVSGNVIDFANTNVWNAMGKILNELCDVFQATPYIHLGADEASLGAFVSDPLTQAAITNYTVGSLGGMFNYFLNRMNDYITARDKNLIVWEGFGVHSGNGRMDEDVTVMMFDNYKNAQTYYINNGYDAINASWYPLYVLKNRFPPQQRIYDWDVYTFGNYRSPWLFRSFLDVVQYEVTKTNNVPGAQMCSWEQPQETEIPTLRPHLPPMADKIWNRVSGKDYTDFTNRFTGTDLLLQKLLAVTVPEAITPSATLDVYPDRIEVKWQAGAEYPWKYSLYRNTSSSFSGAEKIASDKTATDYTDLTAVEGQKYYYWVKAGNNFGYSGFGGSAAGRRGEDADIVYAYEGFDYSPETGLDDKQGGIGWVNAWNETSSGGNPRIIDDNLTYPGLKTSGKCMNVTFTADLPGFDVLRQTKGLQGFEATELWASFLLRVNNVGDGHLFVVPNKAWGTAMAKPWGRALGTTPYHCENGKQYFIVARYDCYNGKDLMYMWVNPSTATEPSIHDEEVGINFNDDLGTGHDFQINIQGYGQNDFDIDEIRLGRSWKEVIGQENREVPYRPSQVTASDGTYFDKVEVTWGEARFATNYLVYRAESASTNAAQEIDSSVDGLSYYDADIVTNSMYYYWVRAENELGISVFSDMVAGRATGAPPVIAAYDGFDYPDGSALNNANGGFGWANGWQAGQLDGTNSTPGLEYQDREGEDLDVSGGKVQFTPWSATEETYVQFTRISSEMLGGNDGDTIWLSFLVNGNTVTEKGFFLMMGGAQVGKTQSGGLGVYNGDGVVMSNDTTYYVSARILYGDDTDTVDVWVDPALSTEPKPEDAVGHREKSLSGFNLLIFRGYGGEGYAPVIDIDEIRLGRAWQNVSPGIPEPGGMLLTAGSIIFAGTVFGRES